jgi:hypothetical protein
MERMFQRRSTGTPYTRPQTERCLTWLAWQLAQHGQTLFFIEHMQPDWLPPQQRWWPTTGVGVACGLVFGLLGGLGSGVYGYLTESWTVEIVH